MSLQDVHDLELIVNSRIPIVVIESHEEDRILELFERLAPRLGLPLYRWTATEGLHRLASGHAPQRHAAKPTELLAQIKASTRPGTYLLFDFHPYLADPIHVRYLKDIAQRYDTLRHTVVLVSHALDIPSELERYSARLSLKLPDADALRRLVAEKRPPNGDGATGAARCARVATRSSIWCAISRASPTATPGAWYAMPSTTTAH